MERDHGGGRGIFLAHWIFWAVLIVGALFVWRYVFSADRRAEGYPAPPSSYENVGGVDEFPVGGTRIRDGVWIVRSEGGLIQAFPEDRDCPLSVRGARVFDCRGEEVRPGGYEPRFCTWVYPPAGDVWVYFQERWGPEKGACPGLGMQPTGG